jgi:hypothetical protein
VRGTDQKAPRYVVFSTPSYLVPLRPEYKETREPRRRLVSVVCCMAAAGVKAGTGILSTLRECGTCRAVTRRRVEFETSV